MDQTLDAINGTLAISDVQAPTTANRQNCGQSLGNSSSAGRFEIQRLHACGGLGQVSVALDTELHRQVALKEIQPQFADQPDSRARFVLEAEVTGGLEHPGVVPVYGLGKGPDGRPFYAMRFIRGESFEAAIERFHAERPDVAERGLRLRKLLRHFIEVCNAVEYAHSRGVLHRDLKPANVMLGRYGETLVVDWGLAKTMDGRHEPRPRDETPLAPPSAGSTPPTRLGSALGTPAYMSPEQAAGALDQLGPASDVYSLGATLYTLLTNKTPFEVDDWQTARRQILEGRFPPPRAICPQVPRQLEAICLKAMATEPTERYASARALADDIENWLGDAQVTAYREGAGERLARWSRRHRAWTRAAAVALLLVSVVSVAAAIVVNRARQQIEDAHHQRALAQVELLRNAPAAAVPAILDNLRPYRADIEPRLRDLLARGGLTEREVVRLDLTLLGGDPTRATNLLPRLLDCSYEDSPLIRDRLRPHAASFVDPLRRTLHNSSASASERFHAALALADYAPNDRGWENSDGPFLMDQMLAASVDDQRELRAYLRPVAARLLNEALERFADASRPRPTRNAAARAIADWGADDPVLLARGQHRRT